MHQDILDAIKLREKRIDFAGRQVIIRELTIAANLGLTGEEAPDEASWRVMVRCVLNEDGTQLFSDDDIAALKAGSRLKLMTLLNAVNEVNGLNADAETKN